MTSKSEITRRRQSAIQLQQQDQLLEKCRRIEKEIFRQPVNVSLASINEVAAAADRIIDNSNSIKPVESSTEMVLDSVLLKFNYDLLSKVIQKTMCFNETSYINNLKRITDENGITNWSQLSEIVCRLGYSIFVHSPISLLHKELSICQERKAHRQTQSRKLEMERRPETLKKLERKEQGMEELKDTRKQIEALLKASNSTTIPFYKLIIDPDDLMNTAINALQLSFLLSDGSIIIENGSDNLPAVRLCNSSEFANRAPKQAVCTLTMDIVQKMVTLYDITTALLKPKDQQSDESMS